MGEYPGLTIRTMRPFHIGDGAIIARLPAIRYRFPPGDALVANLASLRDEMESLADGAPGRPLSEVRLLSPVANPTKIIGTPRNYELHAAEATADTRISGGRERRPMAEQGRFPKANSALVGPGEGVGRGGSGPAT